MPSPSDPAATEYLLSVISGERRGFAPTLLRGVLAALAFVYVAGLKLFLLPYWLGIRKQARLACPVISIGNLTVGGTGKTPMTQLVCRLLQERGLKICVLSRGYRGGSEHGVAVVSTPERVEADAATAGDEAIMLARSLPGVAVVVGKDRRETGRLAFERFRPSVIVMDDGMQFYQLHRDLDVVLLDATRPFDNGWTFPRGLLREPPSHLGRAGCVVLTNAGRSNGEALNALRVQAAHLAPRAALFTSESEPARLRALDRSGEHPITWLQSRRVATLCALGNPAAFEQQVAECGAQLVHTARFADHAIPTMSHLQREIEAACAAGAEAMIVTEKDAVKLPPLGRPLPFLALQSELRIDKPCEFVATLLEALPA